MADFVRRKQVTDPLDDQAKARLVGVKHLQLSYGNSGSKDSDEGDNSPCLSKLVHDFLEDSESENQQYTSENELDLERVASVSDCTDVLEDIIRSAITNNVDSYKKLLIVHVSEAVETFSFLRSNVSLFRQKVMVFLRELGHNAAICKTKWDKSGGITAGNYEFIDVIQSKTSTWQNRYFIDLEFSGQLEIARPTIQYSELIKSLPRVFVGKEEELKRIVSAMCEVVKKSLSSNELSVPPWRKYRYMQNKWFGPYRRITNQVQGNTVPFNSIISVNTGSSAKCRFVGFNGVVSDVNRGVFINTIVHKGYKL